MLVEMGSIIGNSVFPCMVGSPITSVPSMAGRVRTDFTSEHNSSLHIPKQSVSRNQVQLCHVTLPLVKALVYSKSSSPPVIQSIKRFFFLNLSSEVGNELSSSEERKN